jgi:hypothetical protein
MDPVSLIVAALVNGILNGLQRTGEQIVVDGYAALKSAIIRKYGVGHINQLEQDPQSSVIQNLVKEDLRRAGADRDTDIERLAQRLLTIVSTPQWQGTSQGGQSSMNSSQQFEQIEREGGRQAVREVVERHIHNVIQISATYPVRNSTDLLSTNIGNVRDIPVNIRNAVSALHKQIRDIIQQVAMQIAERQYTSAEQAITGMQLLYTDHQRATQLVQADKKVAISAQALKITVDLFADLNQMILQSIEQSTSTRSTTQLLLGNAILVYELTDYVIDYIESFTVQGVDEIMRLHDENKQKIADLRREQKDLEISVQAPIVDASVRDRILDNIKQRERSITYLEQAWQSYVTDITGARKDLLKIRDQVPTLEAMRKDAKVQINLIQAVAMLQILKQNIGTLTDTVLRLESIKLHSITPNTLSKLFIVS